MADVTKIEWCDHTFNPHVGCTPVSRGCDQCYARREMGRYGQPFDQIRRTTAANWRKPARWLKDLDAAYARSGDVADRTRYVFCGSWCDLFHPAADAWRGELWPIVRDTARVALFGPGLLPEIPYLTWLLLTKRIERAAICLPEDWGAGWPHVLLGATIEHPEVAQVRADLLTLVPARGRFISAEPLLGDVAPVLEPFLHRRDAEGRALISGVVAGGETGPAARPTHPRWARNLRDACRRAGVPWMWKQWGEWAPYDDHRGADTRYGEFHGRDDTWIESCLCTAGDGEMKRVGREKSGRVLDGAVYDCRPL